MNKLGLFLMGLVGILVIFSPVYAIKLGEGCKAGIDYVPCAGNCTTSCDGDNVVKTCTVAHGWCFNENGGCDPCDYRDIGEHECLNIDCNDFDSNVSGSEVCVSGGGYAITYADYTCDDQKKTCSLDSFISSRLTDYNPDCCPMDGDVNRDFGFSASTRSDIAFHVIHLTNRQQEAVDSSMLFASLDASKVAGSGGLRLEALDEDGNRIFTVGDSFITTSSSIFLESKLLPVGTRHLRVVQECLKDQTNKYKCLSMSGKVTLSCTPILKDWYFDIDGDGYTSYIIRGLSNPPDEAYCENIMPGISQCKNSIYWRSSTPVREYEPSCENNNYMNSMTCRRFDQDDQITAETEFCEDLDDDGYAGECGDYEDGRKPKESFKGMDCDGADMNSSLNPETIWVEDSDSDGYWGNNFVGCRQDTDDWSIIDSMPSAEKFDCDDDDNQIKQPKGCYCSEIGHSYRGYFCQNDTASIKTKSKGDTAFGVLRNYEGGVWKEASARFDFLGENSVFCPLDTCPIVIDDVEYCAQPGTSWGYFDGEVHEGAGNFYCSYQEEQAYWSTRSARIGNFMLGIAEEFGQDGLNSGDYVVMCDDMLNIAHTFNMGANGFTTGRNWMTVLLGGESGGNVGTGCILLLNPSYNDEIAQGDVPTEDSQKAILGFPVTITDISNLNGTMGLDFEDPSEDNQWLYKIESNMYYYKPLRTLFILQDEEDVKTLFNKLRNPNRMDVNLLGFLRNPIGQVIYLFKNQYVPDSWNSMDDEDLHRFDKFYLARQNDFYLYSVMDNNQFITKLTNLEQNSAEQLKYFIHRICKNGYKGNDLDCAGVDVMNDYDSSSVEDTIAITANLQYNHSDVWKSFTRQLRLMNNEISQDEFFTEQCNITNYETECPKKTCFIRANCTLGICTYDPQTDCVDDDGCCPAGCTYEGFDTGDNDCTMIPPVIPLYTRISSDNCNPLTETKLFELSSTENAHISLSGYQFEEDEHVCIWSEQGDFETYLNETCQAGNSTVVLTVPNDFDAHVGTGYSLKLCLNHSLYQPDCKIGREEDCSGYRHIVSLTSEDNAHAGVPEKYDTKLCCKLIE